MCHYLVTPSSGPRTGVLRTSDYPVPLFCNVHTLMLCSNKIKSPLFVLGCCWVSYKIKRLIPPEGPLRPDSRSCTRSGSTVVLFTDLHPMTPLYTDFLPVTTKPQPRVRRHPSSESHLILTFSTDRSLTPPELSERFHIPEVNIHYSSVIPKTSWTTFPSLVGPPLSLLVTPLRFLHSGTKSLLWYPYVTVLTQLRLSVICPYQ